MITLKETKEDNIQKFVSDGEARIIPKYRGNRIFMIVESGEIQNIKFMDKSMGRILNDIDFMVSDLYDEPVRRLMGVSGNIKNNKDHIYEVTNNLETGNLYYKIHKGDPIPNGIDHGVFEIKPFATGDDIKNIFKNLILDKDEPSIKEELDLGKEVSCILFESKKASNFKIDHNNSYDSNVPSDAFNIVQADVIRKTDPESVTCVIPQDPQDEVSTYIDIISDMFVSYVEDTAFDLDFMDFEYPENMKVKDPKSKIKDKLSIEVQKIILKNPKYYDLFVLLLITFSKDKIKGNSYATDKLLNKHKLIRNNILNMMINPLLLSTTPSYSEYSSK